MALSGELRLRRTAAGGTPVRVKTGLGHCPDAMGGDGSTGGALRLIGVEDVRRSDEEAWQWSFGAEEDELTEGKQQGEARVGMTRWNLSGAYRGRRTNSGGGLPVLGKTRPVVVMWCSVLRSMGGNGDGC